MIAAQSTCRGCVNRGTYRTCLEPVAAGLAEAFCIVWPPAGYDEDCPAKVEREADPEAPETRARAHLAEVAP